MVGIRAYRNGQNDFRLPDNRLSHLMIECAIFTKLFMVFFEFLEVPIYNNALFHKRR